jgi:hypothetical protein
MEEEQGIEERKSRRKLIIGMSAVVALLVAGTVVGTWLAGVGPLGGEESESEPFERLREAAIAAGLPEGMPTAMGLVTGLTATTLDLEEPVGLAELMRGDGGPPTPPPDYEPDGEFDLSGGFPPDIETKMVQIVLSKETRVLKLVTSIMRVTADDENPEFIELSLADIEAWKMIMVWGEKSGDRIYADTIVILRL